MIDGIEIEEELGPTYHKEENLVFVVIGAVLTVIFAIGGMIVGDVGMVLVCGGLVFIGMLLAFCVFAADKSRTKENTFVILINDDHQMEELKKHYEILEDMGNNLYHVCAINKNTGDCN